MKISKITVNRTTGKNQQIFKLFGKCVTSNSNWPCWKKRNFWYKLSCRLRSLSETLKKQTHILALSTHTQYSFNEIFRCFQNIYNNLYLLCWWRLTIFTLREPPDGCSCGLVVMRNTHKAILIKIFLWIVKLWTHPDKRSSGCSEG